MLVLVEGLSSWVTKGALRSLVSCSFNLTCFWLTFAYYTCFIDDIIVIYDVSLDPVVEFIDYHNSNELNISFSYALDPEKWIYLSLELFFNENDKIVSNTHFKETSRNLHLHNKISHNPEWKSNITCSQFLKLVINYTNKKAYLQQCKI